MRVNFYFRSPGPFNFSIEKVFRVLEETFDGSVTINKVYTKTPIDLSAIYRFRKLDADIHHVTGAVNYLTFAFPPHKTVLTVHDIRHYAETFKGIKKSLYGHLFWHYPLRFVKHITTISEFTKEQLISHFHVNPDKITVIPNPVDKLFTYRPYAQTDLPQKFIVLQLGNSLNKNIDALIEAVVDLPVRLLLLRRPNENLLRRLREKAIEFEFRADLTDEDVVRAYNECHLVYFASTYEGFGLPIIEGMSVGRPVITSNISPMKEVANNAAVLVDPYDYVEIREAIVAIMSSRELYNELVRKGRINVKKYQADVIACKYHKLYQSILSTE
jgi:glycosyltransferase involved in cell wall biosynthesis